MDEKLLAFQNEIHKHQMRNHSNNPAEQVGSKHESQYIFPSIRSRPANSADTPIVKARANENHQNIVWKAKIFDASVDQQLHLKLKQNKNYKTFEKIHLLIKNV